MRKRPARARPRPTNSDCCQTSWPLPNAWAVPCGCSIVPARNVMDAIVGTVVRLRSSDIHVGESATLSAADQARLLGEAWERADKPEALDVRLVIHHRSGRADTFHLGAHPPSLTPATST